MMALAATGRFDAAQRMLAAMRDFAQGPGSLPALVGDIALPVTEAVLLHARGEQARAVAAMRPVLGSDASARRQPRAAGRAGATVSRRGDAGRVAGRCAAVAGTRCRAASGATVSACRLCGACARGGVLRRRPDDCTPFPEAVEAQSQREDNTMSAVTGVHLIGSVPLPDAETVFRTVARELGPFLARIPDGETGNRRRWIWWQREMLLRHPSMELDPDTQPFELRQWDGALIRTTDWLRFKPGVDPATVTFDTGYAAAARESYATFRRLRDAGDIPAGVRFQVCLPTPMASGYMYVSPSSLAAYLPAYERALLAALREIADAIPHRDLSIQWDVCQEVLVFEDYFPHRPPAYKEDVFAMLARLGDAVPDDVECGYHLCYGSPRDEHLVMPKDTAILVEIAQGRARAAAPADGLPAFAGAAGPLGRRRISRRSRGWRCRRARHCILG